MERRQRGGTPLATMLRLYLATQNLTMRDLAAQIGCSSATVCRLSQGKMVDVPTFLRLITWLLRGRGAAEG